MLGEVTIEGDTRVGRAPEVGAFDDKVGKGGRFRWAGRGKLGHARLV